MEIWVPTSYCTPSSLSRHYTSPFVKLNDSHAVHKKPVLKDEYKYQPVFSNLRLGYFAGQATAADGCPSRLSYTNDPALLELIVSTSVTFGIFSNNTKPPAATFVLFANAIGIPVRYGPAVWRDLAFRVTGAIDRRGRSGLSTFVPIYHQGRPIGWKTVIDGSTAQIALSGGFEPASAWADVVGDVASGPGASSPVVAPTPPPSIVNSRHIGGQGLATPPPSPDGAQNRPTGSRIRFGSGLRAGSPDSRVRFRSHVRSASQLASYNNRLDTHEADINSHTLQLNEHTARLNTVESRVDDHDGRITSHDGALPIHEAQINNHTSQINEHDTRLDAVEAYIDDHGGQLNDDRIASHDDRIASHDDRITSHDGVLETHNDRLDDLNTRTSIYGQRINDVEADVTSLHHRTVQVERHVPTLAEAVAADRELARGRFAVQDQRIETVEEETTQLGRRVSTAENHACEALQVSKRLDRRYDTLAEAAAAERENLTTVTSQIAGFDRRIATTEREARRAIQAGDENAATAASHSEQIDSLANRNDLQDMRIAEIATMSAANTDTLATYDATQGALQEAVTQTASAAQTNRRDIYELSNHVDANHNESDELASRLDRRHAITANDLHETRNEVNALRDEQNKTDGNVSALGGRMDRISEQQVTSARNQDDLNEKLATMAAHNQQVSGCLVDIEGDVNTLRHEQGATNSNVNIMGQQIERISSQQVATAGNQQDLQEKQHTIAAQNDRMSEQLVQVISDENTLEAQQSATHSNVDIMSQQIERVSDQQVTITNDLHNLRADHHSTASHHDQMSGQLVQIANDSHTMRNNVDTLMNDRDIIRGQIDRMSGQFAQLLREGPSGT